MKTNTPPSEISRVLVLPNRARVTRSLPVKLGEAGEHSLHFENLPNNVDENSLRTWLENLNSQYEIKVLGLETITRYLEGASVEAIQKLEAEIEKLKFTLQKESLTATMLREESLFLMNFKLEDIQEKPLNWNYQKYSLADLQDFSNYTIQAAQDFDQKSLQKNKIIQELQQKLDVAQRELSSLQNSRHSAVTNCIVKLESLGPVSLDLCLSYLLPNAGWNPVYESRLFSKEKEMELTCFGEVFQETGEEWNDITLSLSTAKPFEGPLLPEFTPWFINFYSPPKPMAKSSKKMKFRRELKLDLSEDDECEELDACCAELPADEFMKEAEIAPPPCPEPEEGEIESETVFSEISGEGSRVYFDVPGKNTIPPDGSSRQAAIHSRRFPVELEYELMPLASENVYIKATFTNPFDFTLLPGDNKVFHGADYVGENYLEQIQANEKVSVYLGVDEEIKVKHLLLNRFEKKKSFRSPKVDYHYQTTLSSQKDYPVQLRLIQNIPVSRSDDIKVKINSAKPEFSVKNKNGVLEWNLELPAGSSMNIDFQFSIEHPKNKKVAGLD